VHDREYGRHEYARILSLRSVRIRGFWEFFCSGGIMIIKVKKSIDDGLVVHDHKHLSRREFVTRGIYTGALTVALPKILLGGLVKDAVAATTCPAPARDPGGISHLYCSGGMTVGAYILTDIPAQIAASSTNAAARYGINGPQMLNLGPNFNVNSGSIFWKVLEQTGIDLGYTRANWLRALSKVGAGAHYGPFSQDDGGADATGLLGRTSALKKSSLGKGLDIGVRHKLVPFGNGMPTSIVKGRPSVNDLANVFSLTPNNRINAQTMTNSATAASSLSELFASMFGMKTRTGGEAALTNMTCGFLGNAPLADPAYGASLFNPAQIPALAPAIASGRITTGEQAYLAAFYNSAIGVTAGNGIEEGGFDYHGQTPANIGSAAARVARIVGMWVAGCDKANAKGTLSIVSNGQARATGFTAAAIAVSGGNSGQVTGNVQNAVGDAGGSFNACTLLAFDPAGAPPALKTVGAFDTVNGDVRGKIGAELALQGVYASALQFVSGSVSNAQRIRLGFSNTQAMTSVML
jgi:hypothetical protein